MFDTMTLTKVVGGLCGSLLIFLMGKWAAETIYHTGGGHGDDHHAAYVIDTGEDDDHGGAEEEEGPSLAELYAAADADKGEKVFGKCKACHKAEKGANATGPYLHGVVGRDIGAAEGFGYSGALSEVAEVWTVENLYAFLEAPKKWAPGTTMAYNGLSKSADRVNLIAYLDMLDGDMTEMAVPVQGASMEEGADDEAEANMAEEVTAEEPVVTEVEPTPEAEAAAEEATEEATMEAEEPAAEEPAVEEEAAMEEPAAEEPAAEETEMAEAEMAEEEAAPAMAMAGDVAAGEKVYRKCKACHAVEDGKNRVGPHLYGIMGREVASVDGFKYSDAMQAVGGTWTPEQMDAWLADPKGFAPGNKMSFAGLKKEDDRVNIIAYLATIGN